MPIRPARWPRRVLPPSFLLAVAAAASSQAAPVACPIPGSRVPWTADYCMALLETDDETLAGPCLDQELPRRFVNACQAVGYYKQSLCSLAIQRGSYPGRAEDCLADASFHGPSVRRELAEAAAPAPPP
jgi:hypothetical protein